MKLTEYLRQRMESRRTKSPAEPVWGFTLMEMMIVIAIMLILISIAAGRYQAALTRTKEAALKQDLSIMREAIQQYTVDKEQPPQSLQDLVSAGYLRDIPVDPFTRERNWQTTQDNIILTPEQTQFGITDVHSASNEISPFEKTPYSSW